MLLISYQYVILSLAYLLSIVKDVTADTALLMLLMPAHFCFAGQCIIKLQ